MDEEGAVVRPFPEFSLSQPPRNNPPSQNGSGTHDGARGQKTAALPRKSYAPHARPPGSQSRYADADLTLGPPSVATPLFESLLDSGERVPWRQILAGILRSERLPPLVVTSQPIPVADIWGTYNFRKRSLLSSSAAHVACVLLLFAAMSRPSLPGVMRQSVELSIPVEIDRFLPAAPQEGGGGGGEDSPVPANEGILPRFQFVQLAPIRPTTPDVTPRLPVRPSLLGPEEMQANVVDWALLGSPLAEVGPPSAGPGEGGGIGSAKGSGVGSGQGGGFGNGKDLGLDGVFEVGGIVTAPKLVARVDPEYSERARAQRLQGAVLLAIEVWPDGRAHNVRVVRGLGLGLDDRAVEAVQKWEFEPGTKNGRPVRVACRVELIFQLF